MRGRKNHVMSSTIRRPLVTIVMMFGLTLTALGAAPAASAAPAAPTAVTASAPAPSVAKFKSCKKLNAKYKGGVAKNKSARNWKRVNGKKVLAKSVYRPKVSKALYKKNKRLDRDRDGIACER
jgi:hypothetical protein